jgi:hypothetical protein
VWAFERLVEFADDEGVETFPAEVVENLYGELDGLRYNVWFDDLDECLDEFAAVYAAQYRAHACGQYRSIHGTLVATLDATVRDMRTPANASPPDWDGVRQAFLDRIDTIKRIAQVIREQPELIQNERVDALNDALGRFQPPTAKRGDPFGTPASSSGTGSAIADWFKVDVEQNRVWCGGQWYEVTTDGASLCNELVNACPDYIRASENYSKPSRLKASLPGPVKAHIETAPGKGYRLVNPAVRNSGAK